MNRSDLQQLSEMRLSDAKVLLSTGLNDAGAYYVAGYAVECALKACIAKQRQLHEFPPSPEDIRKIYSHSVKTLIETAGLKADLEAELKVNATLKSNWALVSNWNETFRYETVISRSLAENLIQATDDPQDGILTWLKKRW